MTMLAVKHGEGDHADGREAGADHQGVGQYHRQVLAQGRGQGVAHVHGDDQGDQPGPELAQGKTQQVDGAWVLRQFFAEAEAQAHLAPEPDHGTGEETPEREDQGEGEDHRQPFAGRQHQVHQFALGQVEFLRPAIDRAVVTGKLLFEASEGAADQPQHAFFGGRLGFPGAVAQALQVGQQLGALLVVLQALDHFIEGLRQGFAGDRLGFFRAGQQARQARRVGADQWQEAQQADE